MTDLQVIRKKEEMILALKSALGVVTTACKSASLPRSTHYLWMKSDTDYAARVAEIDEHALDFVESKAMQLINGMEVFEEKAVVNPKTGEVSVLKLRKQLPPDSFLTKFYLATKGKSRGYTEKLELSTGDTERLKPSITIIQNANIQANTNIINEAPKTDSNQG